MLKAICDIRTEANPSFTPIIVNNIKKLAPMITSGLTIKMLFNERTVFRIFLFFIETIANAPSTPITVEINAERRAMTIVLIKIIIIVNLQIQLHNVPM